VIIYGDGCVYGGACAQRYNMVTSYIDYNSIDNTKNIKIANTYYASDRSGLHYDVYHYIIDSMSFRLPSDYEYYPKNIDSLIIRDTMYTNVRELISQNSKSYIYINRNAKIRRYVNKQTGDTLDFE